MVDTVDLSWLPAALPTSRFPGRQPGEGLAVVGRRDFELPPEARELVDDVRSLRLRVQRAKEKARRDLEGIKTAAADERRAVEREVAQRQREAEAQLRDLGRKQETRLKEDSERVAAERKQVVEDRAALEELLANRVHGFELIADAWADYEVARAERDAARLEEKPHPAPSAAHQVRAKGIALAVARRELKRAQWVLTLYEFHFPWLAELREIDEELSYVEGEPVAGIDASADDSEPPDAAQRWLSKEEYAALAAVERNQRALDRYLRSRKSPWQLGRDYERYIGYLREQTGAKVTYQGIVAGLDDLGRDLICETPEGIEIVQCKRWSRHKVIHEKHVFQLLGTVLAMRIERPDKPVSGTFTTTTRLSDRARQFAEMLGVCIEEKVPLADYPRIKCNIGRSGQRIYHLPFDQQYDAAIVEQEKGEAYVRTVADAESLGFRRAWRWKSARLAPP